MQPDCLHGLLTFFRTSFAHRFSTLVYFFVNFLASATCVILSGYLMFFKCTINIILFQLFQVVLGLPKASLCDLWSYFLHREAVYLTRPTAWYCFQRLLWSYYSANTCYIHSYSSSVLCLNTFIYGNYGRPGMFILKGLLYMTKFPDW